MSENQSSLKLNLQHFASEPGLTKTANLGDSISIDFASQFEKNFKKFLEVLGVTRKIPMSVGTAFHQYRMSVKLAEGEGEVAEGDVIPLSEVSREKVAITELTFKKYRKATPMEAIQAHGYDLAVTQTNDEFIKALQKTIRNKFFQNMIASVENEKRTNKKEIAQPTLQGALAFLRSNLETVADDEISMIAFVNPEDVAQHIADGKLNSIGAVYGLNVLQDHTGNKIITNKEVPEGQVLGTLAENIVVPYVNMGGEVSKAFNFSKDSLGFIGVTHDPAKDRLTAETVAAHGVHLFIDNIDLIQKASIVAPTPTTEPETLPEGA